MGGTGGTTLGIGDSGTFGRDVGEGGWHTHRFSDADYGEAGAAEGRQEMGYD